MAKRLAETKTSRQSGYSSNTDPGIASKGQSKGGYPSGDPARHQTTTQPKIITFNELCNPTPKQLEFLAAIDTKRYVLYGGAGGGGKALSVLTPIPTPTGWTTMGEFRVGDTVYSESGKPIKVIACSENFREKSYELEFGCGQKVVCGYRHEWITSTNGSAELICRTTQDIVDTLELGHRIPVCVSPVRVDKTTYYPEDIAKKVPQFHRIISVKEIPDVDLKCIQVDSPTHQYLCTEAMIPTHNSYILRWALIYKLLRWAQMGHKNVRVGMFCEDYPALKDRQMTKIETEFPGWLGTLKDSAHEYRLADRFGGGSIAFRNLDDPSKYSSSEFAAIAVDELTKNRMEVFDQLRWRMRWPGIDDVVFMGATNPGGVGHSFCRQFWIDRIFPPELEKYADQFQFIQAKSIDNPHLSSSYSEMLQTLPTAMRMAYAEGSWDLFEGMVFDEWSPAKHIVKPFEIPDSWTKVRCMDWGFSKPYAIYWGAVDYDGVIWIYREMYGIQNNQPDVGTKETAREVAMRVRALEKGERIHDGVADPACWTKTGTGPSVAEEFDMENIYWEKADNSRLAGKMQFHSRLRDGGLKFFSTCRHAIRTIPQLVYDKVRVEDVDTNQEDHCLVAGTMIMTARGEVPIEDVAVGDVVINRFGWFSVAASGMTNSSAIIHTVSFSNGAHISGTGNHKLITAKGNATIDSLRYGDIMVAATDYIQEVSPWQIAWKQSCSMASRIVATQTQRDCRRKGIIPAPEQTRRRGSLDSTATYGNSITERFLMGITYIMALAVTPITLLRILSACRVENIYPTTPSRTLPARNTWFGYGPLPQSGVNLRLVMTGMSNMAKTYLSRLWKTLCRKNANNVAITTTCQELWRAALSSAATTASQNTGDHPRSMMSSESVKSAEPCLWQTSIPASDSAPEPVRVMAVSIERTRSPVYSLHIDTAHEYIANGICSQNSYDAIRYLCMSRPWTPRMVKSEIETAEEEYKRMMDYRRKQHDDIAAAWGEETSWMGR